MTSKQGSGMRERRALVTAVGGAVASSDAGIQCDRAQVSDSQG